MTISDDSTLIAAGFEEGLIRLFSIGSETLKELKTVDELENMNKDNMDMENILKASGENCRSLVGHAGSVFGISISPRRDFLVSGGEDGTIRLWSLLVYQGIIVHKGHLWPVWDVHFSLGYRISFLEFMFFQSFSFSEVKKTALKTIWEKKL